MVESLCSATWSEDGMVGGGSGDGKCVEMQTCSSYLLGTMGGILTHEGKRLVWRVGRFVVDSCCSMLHIIPADVVQHWR